MTRKPQSDTSPATTDDGLPQDAPVKRPVDGNPNERLEQWEERYFEDSPGEGRGDPGPNP